MNGKHQKFTIQGCNKIVTFLMQIKGSGYWYKRLAWLSEKRNAQMINARKKAAIKVGSHFFVRGTIARVFCCKDLQKNGIALGKETNHRLVQISTGRLTYCIVQVGEKYGTRFIEAEESYTSKPSVVNLDFIAIGAKLVGKASRKGLGWKASGKRVKRGLYRIERGWPIDSGCNGCGNIAIKVAVMLGLEVSGISRGVLSAPLRLKLGS